MESVGVFGKVLSQFVVLFLPFSFQLQIMITILDDIDRIHRSRRQERLTRISFSKLFHVSKSVSMVNHVYGFAAMFNDLILSSDALSSSKS